MQFLSSYDRCGCLKQLKYLIKINTLFGVFNEPNKIDITENIYTRSNEGGYSNIVTSLVACFNCELDAYLKAHKKSLNRMLKLNWSVGENLCLGFSKLFF